MVHTAKLLPEWPFPTIQSLGGREGPSAAKCSMGLCLWRRLLEMSVIWGGLPPLSCYATVSDRKVSEHCKFLHVYLEVDLTGFNACLACMSQVSLSRIVAYSCIVLYHKKVSYFSGSFAWHTVTNSFWVGLEKTPEIPESCCQPVSTHENTESVFH